MIKFSIVTVCYNSATTIQDTIESVLAQTYKNIEYIVVDGNSKDTTLEIIKKFEPKFGERMKWISEPDRGLYDAMNKGIKMSTGDIIGIVNSDDLFSDKDAITKIVEIFENHENIDSVYADLFYVNKENISKIIRRWISGTRRPFKYGWHPAHPTFYLKKDIYQQYGFFNLDFKLAADFELMLRFIDRYKITTYYLNEPLLKMRLGGETNKSISNIISQNIECIRAFKVNNLKVNAFLYPIFRIVPKLLQFKK